MNLVMRYRGSKRPLALSKYSYDDISLQIRRAVVESFITAPSGGDLEEVFEVVRVDTAEQTETMDAGTIREAYRSLDKMDRVNMFLKYCESDFSNASSLSWHIKCLLQDNI